MQTKPVVQAGFKGNIAKVGCVGAGVVPIIALSGRVFAQTVVFAVFGIILQRCPLSGVLPFLVVGCLDGQTGLIRQLNFILEQNVTAFFVRVGQVAVCFFMLHVQNGFAKAGFAAIQLQPTCTGVKAAICAIKLRACFAWWGFGAEAYRAAKGGIANGGGRAGATVNLCFAQKVRDK